MRKIKKNWRKTYRFYNSLLWFISRHYLEYTGEPVVVVRKGVSAVRIGKSTAVSISYEVQFRIDK